MKGQKSIYEKMKMGKSYKYEFLNYSISVLFYMENSFFVYAGLEVLVVILVFVGVYVTVPWYILILHRRSLFDLIIIIIQFKYS